MDTSKSKGLCLKIERQTHKKSQKYSEKQKARDRSLCDNMYKGASLAEGDSVLVRVTAFKGNLLEISSESDSEEEVLLKSGLPRVIHKKMNDLTLAESGSKD